MGNTQVVWLNLHMVFWGLASLVFVLGFIQQVSEHGDRWPHAIAAMGLLIGLAAVYPDATTSFMNMNESVRESLYPAGTDVSDLYTYMKGVKTEEGSGGGWSADLRGMATYPVRKAVDEVLEYVCRTCVFAGELASALSAAIIAFTFKLFKVVSPLLISFCLLKYTQAAGVKFLTLSLGLCLAPYAFVAADFMLIEIFTSLNTLVTNTVINSNAAAIVAVAADGAATGAVPGVGAAMQIGSYLILSVLLGLMSIFVYLGAPACLLLLLSGESPANAAIVAAMAGAQAVQTLASSATEAAGAGASVAGASIKAAGDFASHAGSPIPSMVPPPVSSGAASSPGGFAAPPSVGATAAAGAGGAAATGGIAAPLAVAGTAAGAAVQTAKATAETAASAMDTASRHSPEGGVSPEASSPINGIPSAPPAPPAFDMGFAGNPAALPGGLRDSLETAKTDAPAPIPPEQPIKPNDYNGRRQ